MILSYFPAGRFRIWPVSNHLQDFLFFPQSGINLRTGFTNALFMNCNYSLLIISSPNWCCSFFRSTWERLWRLTLFLYLTVYYLFKSYTAGTEMKSGTYRIVMILTFMFWWIYACQFWCLDWPASPFVRCVPLMPAVRFIKLYLAPFVCADKRERKQTGKQGSTKFFDLFVFVAGIWKNLWGLQKKIAIFQIL